MHFNLEKELNKEQCKAASTLSGPLLVIAGAGSGKTRMLTFRIAHMLESGIDESNILALTFTNKAAKEMGERIKSLTGLPLKKMTTTTFHSFGMGILKQYIQHLGFKNNFTVYDSNDRMALLKEVIINLDYVPDTFDLYELSNLFSDLKTKRSVFAAGASDKIRNLYSEYEKHLKAYNAVDFDDLIMKPLDLFEKKPEVLAALRNRYTHILVDEFQDTSLSQYRIVELLAQESRNLCVVGDDDQSIYSWRGANYENLVMFERDFPERLEIKLERNYRSTGTILEAANKLIVHNQQRKEKKLWTDSGKGSSISLIHPANEDDESAVIAEQILMAHRKENRPFSDFGVLVRTNSLVPTLETRFMEKEIPTQVSGGQSFFDRKEIRDIVSYLKVLANQDDDINLLRVINTPRRGIGRVTLEKMRKVADDHKCSLYSALSLMAIATDGQIKEGMQKTIKRFVTMIDDYQQQLFEAKSNKNMILRSLIHEIGYKDFLAEEHPDNENIVNFKMKGIGILCDMFARWERNPDNYNSSIFDYINRISIAGKEDSEGDRKGKVALMTMHASKGLEFDTVFLAGIEDQYVPHARAIEDNPANIDEERRLFYVAITRARRVLVISSCERRKRGHDEILSVPSRFLEEIPKELFDEEDPSRELSANEVTDKLRLFREKLEARKK
ncbi:DNA/RNA helicase, superfamily I [Sphaerochaeta pleomorpha str. Grapes]|uniref:DNA 3'-5' helicase n=1 Tax=Sphaerochaeta pleomorpha (strain ATCC BAA-1885 / DSM 22778 / Grapes) TaxID=158190 RepID=G8QY29_SPHPG|nr:UvrD-helicase domain-containing protein [Sphaerochaeta pleomorpha]AEV28534.1 DNA/RNA helicase, superfamily I [Sphaerochaeta pleomorpha str. Grapes]